MNFTPELEKIYRDYENGKLTYEEMTFEVDLFVRNLKKEAEQIKENV